MISKKSNICIIGCGSIGSSHCESIIKYSKRATLHSVFDLNSRLSEKLSQKYSIEVKYDLQEVKEDSEIDIVFICVPNDYHKAITEELAKAGKHILLEVPISNTMEDASSIIEACETHNVKLTLNYSKRYLPHNIRAKQIVDEGIIGQIIGTSIDFLDYRGQGYWSSAPWRGDSKSGGGGVLILHARHSIDYVHNIISQRIKQVSGFSTKMYNGLPIEDSISVSYKYESGAIGSINASFSHIGIPTITERIWGTEGVIFLNNSEGTGEFFSRINSKFGKAGQINSILEEKIYLSSFGIWIDDFVKSIEKDIDPLITGLQGYDNLLFINSVYESIESNSIINLEYKL